MSLHFVLDGYNIINKMPVPLRGPSKRERKSLYEFIRKNHPQGSENNKITAVFDGQRDVFEKEVFKGIEIIFSNDLSADDKIKKMIKDSSRPKDIVVVTDDREIRDFARLMNSRTLSVDEFLAKEKPALKAPNYKVSPQAALKINQELRDLWLK